MDDTLPNKMRYVAGALGNGHHPPGAKHLLIDGAQKIEQLEALCEKLRMEAEAWAQEARTQKSTVQECYQAATGSTGEPGDWNGARPVVERIKALEAENEKLREALQRITTCADWPRGNDVHGIADIARDALGPSPNLNSNGAI